MADPSFEKIIRDFCGYYGIKLKNLTFSFDNKIPVAHVMDKDEVVHGLRNIISHVSKPNNLEFDALQDQWAEFMLTLSDNLNTTVPYQVLKELNNHMINKVYFLGNDLGPVDILMYYLLYNFMSNLTFQEKEKFLHTSRWFDNIQQDKNARLWRSVIPFSRSCLYV